MIDAIKHIIRTKLCRRLGVPSIQFALERLKQNGFSPRHVFDVGAYQGDFAALCFDLWPETRVTCFEVLPEPLSRISEVMRKEKNLKVVPCLLGAKRADSVEFHIAETASSVLIEREHPLVERATYPMRTVDDVLEHECFGDAPDFLKMDVQGYELEVLKGATRTLSLVEVVLAEVNLLEIHNEVPLLADFVAWMSSREWLAYDICGLTRRPLDQALWQADIIFVPEKSSFRQNKRYA
jgi:FkbM family methyltransferase